MAPRDSREAMWVCGYKAPITKTGLGKEHRGLVGANHEWAGLHCGDVGK